MSLQAVKAVEIGAGVAAAYAPGSAVHDEIGYSKGFDFAGFTRTRNNAGGIEGGVSNGQEIRVRGYLKPISTLRRPLASVDFATREPVKAAYERSDVCVVPAAGVAGEAMVALTLGRCALEKFGGDSMTETCRNFKRDLGKLERLRVRGSGFRSVAWSSYDCRNWALFFETRHLRLRSDADPVRRSPAANDRGPTTESMIYPIVKFGNPVLEKSAEPVTEFGDELKKLVEDMFESMYEAKGVGLAAPQIGISKRLAVIDVTFKEDRDAKLVLENPEIIHTEGKHSQAEGCLSIPEFREPVTRPKKVTIRAQDINGEWYEKTGEELLARAFLHE